MSTMNEKAARERAEAQKMRDLREAVSERARRAGRSEQKLVDRLEDLAAEHEHKADELTSPPGRAAAVRRLGERHQQAAEDVVLLRMKVSEMRESARERATSKLISSGGGHMDDPTYEGFVKSLTRAANLDDLDRKLRRLEKRERSSAAKVTAEPRVYAKDSPHSYYRDLAAVTEDRELVSTDAQAAAGRLRRYDSELAHEMARGSKEGRRALRAIREETRCEDPAEHEKRFREVRALTSGGGSTAAATSGAAAFVSPYFILEAWAPARGIHRTFADQTDRTFDLPAWGLNVYVPAFTSATSATQQTEAGAVTETDPAATLQGAQVVTVTGQVTISQQLHDRGFTGGGAFDQVIGKQLFQQLEQNLDVYVLNQAITNGNAVTGQATYSTANLYQDLALAREQLTDTAGTRLRPTHVFTTSDLYSYASRQVDSQNRPIITPQFAPGFPVANGADDGLQGDNPTPAWSRFTGTVLPGGVLWFTDDNIPTVGTTNRTQIIVSAPQESVLLLEGDPILSVFPQTDAANLECIVNLRKYVAAITRHASGTAVISSAAYTTSLV